MSHGTVYYNGIKYNNELNPIQAVINDARSCAILDNAESYRCSVVRFSINGSLLPILCPAILNPDGPLPIFTNYSVSLTYLGTTIRQQVIFTAQYGVQVKYSYNYINTVLTDINNAFATCFANLQIAEPLMPATSAPVLIWNPTSQLFSIYFQDVYALTPITISMNYDLFNLFQSFQANYNRNGTLNGRDYDLILTGINVIQLGATPINLPPQVNAMAGTVYYLPQEFQSLSQWSPVQTFFFTSYQIPLRNESLPQSALQSQNNQVNSNSLPIITDFAPILGSDPEFIRGESQYLPTAQYRFITLEGNVELRNVDLACYWRNKRGETYPLLIDTGYYMSVKILFEAI